MSQYIRTPYRDIEIQADEYENRQKVIAELFGYVSFCYQCGRNHTTSDSCYRAPVQTNSGKNSLDREDNSY